MPKLDWLDHKGEQKIIRWVIQTASLNVALKIVLLSYPLYDTGQAAFCACSLWSSSVGAWIQYSVHLYITSWKEYI